MLVASTALKASMVEVFVQGFVRVDRACFDGFLCFLQMEQLG